MRKKMYSYLQEIYKRRLNYIGACDPIWLRKRLRIAMFPRMSPRLCLCFSELYFLFPNVSLSRGDIVKRQAFSLNVLCMHWTVIYRILPWAKQKRQKPSHQNYLGQHWRRYVLKSGNNVSMSKPCYMHFLLTNIIWSKQPKNWLK